MRRDGKGADARERVREEAMGEFGVGDGRGLLLDGPVTKEIRAVFEEKRNQFGVEVVPVGEAVRTAGRRVAASDWTCSGLSAGFVARATHADSSARAIK